MLINWVSPDPMVKFFIVTDASDVGGGATVFQWQSLDPLEIPTKFATTGVKTDGNFLHNYPENFRLVPLGHFHWKWKDTRKDYFTYEQELLACFNNSFPTPNCFTPTHHMVS